MYKSFIEDKKSIEKYIADMRKNGIWAGHLEMHALAQKYKFNVVIHRINNPVMAQENFKWDTVPTLHLSYHFDEHYNCVRAEEDPLTGPAT